MDIESLADKLDAETLNTLREYINSLTSTKKPSDTDTRVQKLETALAKKQKDHEEAVAMYKKVLRENAIAKSMATHEWVDPDLVSLYFETNTISDGDKLLFKSSDGRVVPLDEAAATLAKSKPHLTKQGIQHGSGYQKPKDTTEPVKNPWSREHLNLTEQARILKTDPALAIKLKKEV
jgi:hypothetical protein